ncbi:glycosyltransferase family 25 protein [Pseudochrobactrum asaccharolyticum]|uniref:Glycosyl transferase family 25 n=1 Tax=Pseudochrobactrum asaccharolyticum TaxID=354351 RepID=A0A366DXL9_9HYPH|nr:glycosyltransferase family 25 protein [Pseudochrobactrum asaccharolyticum]RBO94836.1 glycosyl transferase family 25 [Pseudochrobactrum asaccharolyticum]
MKCYLINLDRSKERLSRMQKQFDSIGIDFTRVPAVDGKLLSTEQLTAVIDPIRRWEIPMPASEIGCFLSHKKCIELIANGEDEYAAIFEDDVTLSANCSRFLNDTNWIPTGADIIKIDTNNTLVVLENFQTIDETGYELARLCTSHLCCGGYIVSRKAAALILSCMEKISVPVDNLIYDPQYELFHQLTIYQFVPALCMQIDADSLIEEDRKKLRKEYKKRLSLPVLIWRELTRPYKRNAHIIGPVNIWIRITTGKRWLKVPFK